MLPSKERYMLNERIPETGEYIRYGARTIKLKAKVVCESCNNIWMSELENNHLKPAIKDLLFDHYVATLTPKQIVPIAAFAFKTLVIANHKSLTTQPFFTASQRTGFRLGLNIPDGVQVWMACRDCPAGKYRGFWKSMYGHGDKEFAYGFDTYSVTWNFQNIVLQALATKWTNETRRETVPPISFPQEEYWSQASVPIWPPDGASLQWPPPFYIGDNTIDGFTDRWNEIRVTFTGG